MVTNVDQCMGMDTMEVCQQLMLLAAENPGRFRILFTSSGDMDSLNLFMYDHSHELEIQVHISDLELFLEAKYCLKFAVGRRTRRRILDSMTTYQELG
jgi:hypothetical protein